MHISNIIEYETPIELSFVKKWQEYDDVYSFLFTASKKPLFLAGQNGRIVIPELPEIVAAHSLSFASAPGDRELLFSMHTKSGSAYKNAMLALTEGDVVHLVKVKGDTVLPQDTTVPVVLIAGGVGITPFRSILLDLQERKLDTEVTLIHVSRDTYLYEKELEVLPYTQHRIERSDVDTTLGTVVHTYPHGKYYASGSPLFTEAVIGMLQKNNLPDGSFHVSRFTGYEGFLD